MRNEVSPREDEPLESEFQGVVSTVVAVCLKGVFVVVVNDKRNGNLTSCVTDKYDHQQWQPRTWMTSCRNSSKTKVLK